MPAPFRSFAHLLQDPPPELVFEIGPDSVRMARWGHPESMQIEPLPAGAITPSPLHENVAQPEVLNEVVRRMAPAVARGKKRTAAVLLPDHCAHIAVLDFAKLPDKTDEQLSIIRFRLKRSVPFDVDTAALSFWVQEGAGLKGHREVVAAVTALEIVSRYEAPFRAAGIHPGLVTLAPLACLDLVDSKGIAAVARLSGGVLTILVKQDKTLKVFRSIELAERSFEAISDHLHQTLAFVEDNLGGPAQTMMLAGFGDLEPEALRDFPDQFGLPVSSLGGNDTGIRGYLRGVAA